MPAKKQTKKNALTKQVSFKKHAGAGLEGLTTDIIQIPRLAIIQDASPQKKKTNAKFVKGAETGQIIDLLTNNLFDGEKGILFVPVQIRRTVLEWMLREKKGSGSGFRGDHGLKLSLLRDCERDEKNRMVYKGGDTQMVDTLEYCFLVFQEGANMALTAKPYLVSMSSTNFAAGKQLNGLVTSRTLEEEGEIFPAPICYSSFKLTTVPDSNDQGEWMKFKVETNKDLIDYGDEGIKLYQACLDFIDKIQAGEVEAQSYEAAAQSYEGTEKEEEVPI